MVMPFTYLLVFKNPSTSEKKFYYGARYSKDAHPDQLWTSYFTSSKHIMKLLDEFGPDCFEVEIRKTFSSIDKCREWERKVLVKMSVRTNHSWINKTDNIAPFYIAGEKHHLFGKKRPEHSEKMKGRSFRKGYNQPEGFGEAVSLRMKGIVRSEETRKKMSLARTGIKRPDNSQRMKEIWAERRLAKGVS